MPRRTIRRRRLTLTSWSATCSELVANGAFIDIDFLSGIGPGGTYAIGTGDQNPGKVWVTASFGRYDATCSTNTERTVLGGALVITESSERGVTGTIDFATSTGH